MSLRSKTLNTFLFLFAKKILVWRAGIQKMLVRIANRDDPDQTASSEAVWSGSARLSRLFWQASSVRNFRTFTNQFKMDNSSYSRSEYIGNII